MNVVELAISDTYGTREVRFDNIEPDEPAPVGEPAPKRQMNLGRRG